MLPRLRNSIWFHIFGPKWRLGPLSPRRLFGLLLLLPLLPPCAMAAFGPSFVLGPRPEPDEAGLVRSVRVRDGEEGTVRIEPPIVGPGETFEVTLTFQAGTGGYYSLERLECGMDSALWYTRRYPWTYSNPAPRSMMFPVDVTPQDVTLTYEGVEVPEREPLSGTEITLQLALLGNRPLVEPKHRELSWDYFVERYEVTIHLGHGTIVPTGWLNFHRYNRQTWGLIVLTCLPVIYAIIFVKPRPKRFNLPATVTPHSSRTDD